MNRIIIFSLPSKKRNVLKCVIVLEFDVFVVSVSRHVVLCSMRNLMNTRGFFSINKS